MFLTVHGPVGAAFGATTGEPISAFLLGFASHFVLDAIPHGDKHWSMGKTKAEHIRLLALAAIIDGLLMGLIFLALTLHISFPSYAIIAGAIGGVLPDVLQGLGMLHERIRPLARFKQLHDYVHSGIFPADIPRASGILVQIVALVVALQVYIWNAV